MKNITAITQVRISSTRLPRKVLLRAGDSTVLGLHLQRLRRCSLIDQVIIAAADEGKNETLKKIAEEEGCHIIFGDTKNVLDRFYKVAKNYPSKHYMRFTSDCPLIDPEIVQDLIQLYLKSGADYASNILPATYPDGMDAEIFSNETLKDCWRKAVSDFDKEHVTSFIRSARNIQKVNLESRVDQSHIRLTLDNIEDYDLLNELINKCGPKKSLKDYLHYMKQNPHLESINNQYKRNYSSK